MIAQLVPRVLGFVRCLLSNENHIVPIVFESDLESRFWLNMIEAIKDPYAVEKISEKLLLFLEMENVTDGEAYWILWFLFSKVSENQPSVR